MNWSAPPLPARVTSRLLLASPAWPATALCVTGAVNVGPRYWGPAAGLLAAFAVVSTAAGVGLVRRRPAALRVARVVPVVWWVLAAPLAGWGLLMLPTCWFTAEGLFDLCVAAFVTGYARDIQLAARHPLTAAWVRPAGGG